MPDVLGALIAGVRDPNTAAMALLVLVVIALYLVADYVGAPPEE